MTTEKSCLKCGGTTTLRTVYYRGPKSGGQKFLPLGKVCRSCIEARVGP